MTRLKTWPPPAPREDSIHRDVVGLLKHAKRPDVACTHFPAGELRNPAVARKLKEMGTQAGWPDFLFVIPPEGRLHGLELKREGGRPSVAQLNAHAALQRAGGVVEVAYGLDAAIAVLRRWGVLRGDRKV